MSGPKFAFFALSYFALGAARLFDAVFLLGLCGLGTAMVLIGRGAGSGHTAEGEWHGRCEPSRSSGRSR